MNPFKKAGLALLVVIVVVSGTSLMFPPSTRVSRYIYIERDIETVFSMVNDLHLFNTWSPWARYDPDTRYDFSGPESGVGAKMQWWSRNRKVGRGSREIVVSIPNERVDLSLQWGRRGKAEVRFYLVKQNEGTGLTWSLHLEHGLNLLSRFFGPVLDTWQGAEYEAGLKNLKELLEKENQGRSDHQIKKTILKPAKDLPPL